MDIETYRNYCLSKNGVTESLPFDEVTLVFKVMRKMFAITRLDSDTCRVTLKCDPEYALELREQHAAIQPGFHTNKKHWNTVLFEGGDLSNDFLHTLIDHSYDMVVKGMKKSEKQELLELGIEGSELEKFHT
jgi:predicted DNA-binding protein (MmcQ/YjbR family)